VDHAASSSRGWFRLHSTGRGTSGHRQSAAPDRGPRPAPHRGAVPPWPEETHGSASPTGA